MGWERRGGRQYYCRKNGRGGRATSEYVGRGDFADLVSLLDEEQRATELWIQCPSMKGPLATGVRFQCSIEQLKRWERAAARDDRTLSAWIRRQLDQTAAKQRRKR